MSQPTASFPQKSSSEGSRVTLPVLPAQRSFGQTTRTDRWWVVPLAVFCGLLTFIVYSTWAAFQHGNYWLPGTGYMSPFFAPEIFGDSPHAWFARPSWFPGFVTPAMLILWAPGGFRFTCYYYRGAYYKAFWADPISCAVGEPRKSYLGERYLPLILQNIHRYFMYLAVLFLVFLTWDVWKAMWFTDALGKEHFGIGLGTIILAVNVVMLSCFTFGCHALRHLIGGGRDEISKSPTRKAYNCVTCLNARHMLMAWISLFTVGFCDVYIRLCSMGIWHDLHWSF